MWTKAKYTQSMVFTRCKAIAEEIRIAFPNGGTIAGVPRGGVPVALTICALVPNLILLTDYTIAEIVVDDLIDSGATYEKVMGHKQCKAFYSLIDKRGGDRTWYVFPWEDTVEGSAEDIVTRQLQYIGENVTRDGLKDTPARVLKAWDFLYSGYKMNPKDILGRTFDNTDKYDEMVLLKDIEFYSMCEHHLLPFFGRVHIAYIPGENGRVVGISKLARLVECFARRAQIQENLTNQITTAINTILDPTGCACLVEAQHFCMTARGVQKQKSIMITSSLLGAFRKPETRAEFFSLIKS